MLLRGRRLCSSSLFCRAIHAASTLPNPPKLTVLKTPEDMNEARSWAARFKTATISRSYVDFQFARSSGPGGQVRR